LQLKFLQTCSLLREHELHVIYADELDVIGIDRVVEGLKHEVDRSRPIKVHEVERILLELLQEEVQALLLFVCQFLSAVLLKHGGSEDLISDFKTAP
jgi:hypothetical protein